MQDATVKTLIVVGLGIGVYVLIAQSKKTGGTPTGVGRNPAAASPLAGLLNLFKGIGGTPAYQTSAPGTYDGRAASPWSTAGGSNGNMANNPSAYTAPDSVAATPVGVSQYDAGFGSGAGYGSQDLGQNF